jgi:hypothetical protein
MARVLNRLSDVAVRAKKRPGYTADGGNLYLRVATSGTKGWIFRFTIDGRTRDAGLGAYRLLVPEGVGRGRAPHNSF